MAPSTRAKSPSKASSSSAANVVNEYLRWDIFMLLLALRVVNAFTLSTFFQPDEFYQTHEPAWRLVFGDPHKTFVDGPWVPWEFEKEIRPSLYPVALAGVFKIVDVLGNLIGASHAMKAKMLINLPKLFPAVIACFMDYYTWGLGGKIFGWNSPEAKAVLAITVLSPWQWFCATRTLTNCAETALTIAALYYWPWQWLRTSPGEIWRYNETIRIKFAAILASLAVVLRPTNIIVWLVLSAYTLRRATGAEAGLLIRTGLGYGTVVFLGNNALDFWFYGHFSLPQVTWLAYNWHLKIGDFYGKMPIHYYFSTAIPQLLVLALPFAIMGLAQAFSGQYPASDKQAASPMVLRPLASISIMLPLVLSLVAHKEVRFIYPILPILTILAAGPVAQFFAPFPNPRSNTRKLIRLVLVVGNIAIALYAGHIHNRGLMDVVNHVRNEFEARNPAYVHEGDASNITRIVAGFVMPCHSVPWRSHLYYKDVRAWGITCHPPIDKASQLMLPPGHQDREDYKDETDEFYEDQIGWITKQMATRTRYWPDYMVFFEQFEEKLSKLLDKDIYTECYRTFNTRFNPDWRRAGDIIIWCRDVDDHVDPFKGDLDAVEEEEEEDGPDFEDDDEDEEDLYADAQTF